jgi:hypothetical protein
LANIESAEQKPGMLARYKAERAAKSELRDSFSAVAVAAANGDDQALSRLPSALEEARRAWRPAKLQETLWQVFTTAARQVLADDVMTLPEEQRLERLSEALGTPFDQLPKYNFALFEELMIARINDGRCPRLEAPPLITKKGEEAFASFNVALMKELTLREFRGGSQSVSIPIGLGMRYRVGGVRGRSVIVGTQLVPEDTGALVLTSIRAVFIGQKKSLEFRHDRLLGLQQFTDGLRINVSNRQAASLLRFAPGQSPSIAAAILAMSAAR